MKLVVFGSTGGTGLQVVEKALEQGHEVTAFTRRPERLGLNHKMLRVAEGDVLDQPAVERSVQGQDAVICTLGMPMKNKDMLRANGTQNIIRAMQAAGVRRLVCQSTLGVGDSHEWAPFFYRYLIFPLFLRHALVDHGLQENHIKKSPLEWVIVRPGNLTEGGPTGSYRHGVAAPDTPLTLKVSRADVADFMLKQLTDDTYLHKTPFISC